MHTIVSESFMVDTIFMELRFGKLHSILVERFREAHGTTQHRYFPALAYNSSAILAESLIISET